MKINRLILVLIAALACAGLVHAQSKDEKAIREILTQNTTAFAKNDMPSLDRICANDDGVVVFENGYANYGWLDYRNNHLGPEMKEMTNTKYDSSDIKLHISGKMAYATFKYSISGDSNGRHFDGGGLGTAVLEKRSGKWVLVHWHSSSPRRAVTSAKPGN
jgi:ketosteroid isomerase-like protein